MAVDSSTALWMAGLCLAVGALVFAVAGVVATVGAVGVVLVAEGVFAELFSGGED